VNKKIKIAVLDSVPREYWADDAGITDAQKFIELLTPENSLARFSTYYLSESWAYQLESYKVLETQ
jgi:hypothetical protein